MTIPLRANRIGRYILNVVDFGKDALKKVRGLVVSASYLQWAFAKKRPELSNGGLHLPYTVDPPHTFPACKAAALGDASDGCPSDPEEIVMQLNVNRGHASAQQLKRVSAD